MKILNAILRKNGFALVALLLVFAATGCDALNNQEPEVAALTQEDLETASSILAESLSDQSEGLMANLNDMTADISVSEISYRNRSFANNPVNRPCRGENKEHEKTYDPETGVHTINYSRFHEGVMCNKDVNVNLNYTFTDADGNFMDSPLANKNLVSEIAFTGSRVGTESIVTKRGSSSRSFDQSGVWNLTGLLSDVASLSGSQVNDGSFELARVDTAGTERTRSGTYHLVFNTVDVSISQIEGEGESTDLETQITGTLLYTMSMEKTINGETERREVEGTIELEGNGRALLRFLGLRKIYRVSLDNGDVNEADGENGDTDTDGETGGEG